MPKRAIRVGVMSDRYSVALIGGRGYTGSCLLPLIRQHPNLALVLASSSSQAGEALTAIDPDWANPDQTLEAFSPTDVDSRPADVWVLALPNDQAQAWVNAIDAAHPKAVIVDLSADHRFDDQWVYGLPELNREEILGAKRIANPGCYATAAALGLTPLAPWLDGPPIVFGVSGYSGAGKTPSPRNDPNRLKDNLIPYQLTGHMHEKEISFHLKQPVSFHPHVAQFFRGLSLTVHIKLKDGIDERQVMDRWQQAYQDEPWVSVREDTPEVADIQGRGLAQLGGLSVDARDRRHMAFVVVLDNLLKGAASQAMQNINLSLNLDEALGLEGLI